MKKEDLDASIERSRQTQRLLRKGKVFKFTLGPIKSIYEVRVGRVHLKDLKKLTARKKVDKDS